MTTTPINFETATHEELLDGFEAWLDKRYMEEGPQAAANFLAATRRLAAVPELARQLADERQATLEELVDICYGNVALVARILHCPANTLYRIRNGRAGRTSARRKD